MQTERIDQFYPYHDRSFGCGDGENGRCSVGGPECRVVVGVSHPPTMRTMPFVRAGIDIGVPVAFRLCVCNNNKKNQTKHNFDIRFVSSTTYASYVVLSGWRESVYGIEIFKSETYR